MRTVVFDLDGTLADTSGDLIAAANVTLQALGYSPQLVRGPDDGVALRGGRAMLSLGFDRLGVPKAVAKAGIEAGYPVLLEAYGAAIDRHTVLYPGAVATVEMLRQRGDATAICTNKPEGLAQKLLVSLGVRDLFDGFIGADTLPVRKPDPRPFVEAVLRSGGDPKNACLIGDTVTDRDTAVAAGVPSILVTFGPGRDDVLALAPDATIDHFDDLIAAVDRVLPGN